MSGITLQEAQEQLDQWLAASKAVAANQSYRIGEREFTRVNAEHIRGMIDYWQAKVDQLSPQGTRRRRRVRYLIQDGR